MERPEDFEEREEPEAEPFEPDGGDDAARVDEDRSREGRFGGSAASGPPPEGDERR